MENCFYDKFDNVEEYSDENFEEEYSDENFAWEIEGKHMLMEVKNSSYQLS